LPDMRFAPPQAMRVEGRGGGLNQTSVRTYNERLIMSLLRQHGSLSRMELGQWSGLSAQTVSVIVRALDRDNLVLPGEVQRGRVGPPSTPILLNPEGAFSIGVSVSPRTADVVLIDFNGVIRLQRTISGEARVPSGTLEGIVSTVAEFAAASAPPWRNRIVGVGVSLPEDVDSWSGSETTTSGFWTADAVEASIAKVTELPIFIQNDVTAAAGAEVIFGAARDIGDFAYLFVGGAMECRLVLNHRVYAGSSPSGEDRPGALNQLAALAEARGLNPERVWEGFERWGELDAVLPRWIEDCAAGLTRTIVSMLAFVRIRRVLIEGRMPRPVLDALCESAAKYVARERPRDSALQVAPGEIGPFAKAIGAASLPLHSRFMIEQVGLVSSGPFDGENEARL
jgi:predicted NBD/HSP70 family sugar kinase